jgi:hypothetical protein
MAICLESIMSWLRIALYDNQCRVMLLPRFHHYHLAMHARLQFLLTNAPTCTSSKPGCQSNTRCISGIRNYITIIIGGAHHWWPWRAQACPWRRKQLLRRVAPADSLQRAAKTMTKHRGIADLQPS